MVLCNNCRGCRNSGGRGARAYMPDLHNLPSDADPEFRWPHVEDDFPQNNSNDSENANEVIFVMSDDDDDYDDQVIELISDEGRNFDAIPPQYHDDPSLLPPGIISDAIVTDYHHPSLVPPGRIFDPIRVQDFNDSFFV